MNKPVVIAAACFTVAIGVVSFAAGANLSRGESASLSASESSVSISSAAESSSSKTTTAAKTTTSSTTRTTTSATVGSETEFNESSVADVARAVASLEAEKIIVTEKTTTTAATTVSTAKTTTTSVTSATSAASTTSTTSATSATTTASVSTTAATTTTYKKPSVFSTSADVYAAFDNAIANGDTSVSFTASGSLTLPDLGAILKKYPQITSISYSKRGSSVTYTLGLSAGTKVLAAYRSGNVKKLSAAEKKLYDKCKEIISKCTKPTNTLEENMKAIHDYIVLNTAYDYENFLKGTIPERSQTAEGALIYGKAVCGGYTDAFQLLMNMCGYECGVVKGTARNDTFSGAHAWNTVKIGKETRYVDVCWDDPLNQPPDYVRYLYYNLSAEEINKDHFPAK